MSYEVLARKYRPRRLDEVAGQEAITRVLRGAIEQDRVGHAFLFCGPRGVGKTSTARILAAALNCENGPTADPCGECESCLAIAQGRAADVVEIDGASNRKIDDIRALREQVNYAPMQARLKLYIIDEVHQLTSEAFNALLKTLEEPPAHVKFIFATTEVEKVPETIRSRCQIHEFRRIREEDITARLEQICVAEERPVPGEVLAAIARGVRGGMRDAQTLLDQLLALGPDEPSVADLERISGRSGAQLALRWLQAAAAGAPAQLLSELAEVLERGRREEDLIDELVEALRELLLLDTLGAETELSAIPPEKRGAWIELARGISGEEGGASGWIDGALSLLLRARGDLRRALGSSRLVLELSLVRLAELRGVASLEAIVKRLEAGEFGTAPTPAAAPRPRRPPATAPAERGRAPARPARRAAEPAAQRARPQAAPERARSATGLTIEEIFERFLAELGRSERGLAELCQRRLEPAQWTGERLVVRLAGADFTEMALIGDAQNRRMMEDALKSAVGAGAALEIELGAADEEPHRDSDPGPDAPNRRSSRAQPGEARGEPDPFVDRVRELFDGEEVGEEG